MGSHEKSLDESFSAAISEGVEVRAKVVIPLRLYDGREVMADVHTFRGLCDSGEHLAIGLGRLTSGQTPLVRLHSECLTGDTFGSARCDCGGQLREAIEMLSKRGGFLLYLRQEGRGIGLYNKLDAYRIQDLGYDTYEANRKLNFKDDLRDYRAAAQMLSALNVSVIDLLTNNPDKVGQLAMYGIRVRRLIRTGIFVTVHNHSYLAAKAKVTRHQLDLTQFSPEGEFR